MGAPDRSSRNPFSGPVDHDPFAPTAAAQDFLRALFVQLSLAPRPPTVRPDLLLVVIEALRMTNASYLRVGRPLASAHECEISGHSGELAVHVARAHGVETMFTLSGAHVFPMYDGAVQTQKEGQGPPMRLLDVRHEQTAAFAAEATGKLTRVPGLAVLTAGPGVTNGISAIAQA